MARLQVDVPAPDFTLDDLHGRPVRLSQWRGERAVVLVINRGFI